MKTSGTSGAGTDDNVYLRVNDRLRFKLDRFHVDDFERNQKAVYSLAVDTSTPFDKSPSGYTLRDIQYLQLEKSKDGSSGAWKLGGVRLFVNGRVAYGNASIEQWLRGDNRTWRPTDFRPPPDSAETIPVWLSLYDADSFLYGGDDHADLHPDYRRRNVGIIYPLGTVVERKTVGGSACVRQPLQLRRRSRRDPLPHRDGRIGAACGASPATAAATTASATASASAASAAASASARLPRPRHLRPRHHDVHGHEPGHRGGRAVQRARDRVPARRDQPGSRPARRSHGSTRRAASAGCARRVRTT